MEENLDEFLKGSKTVAEIIKEGGQQLWSDFNRYNPLMTVFADAVTNKVRPLIKNNDILELGGGVGGTTIKLYDNLMDASSFTFTDIKRYFLDQIKLDLPDIDINTEILDLKRPPEDFPTFK